MKKAYSTIVFLAIGFMSLPFLQAQGQITLEFSAGINSTQSIGLMKNSMLKSDYKWVSKEKKAGVAYDFGLDALLKIRANYIKTGIHLNNWNSEINISYNYDEEPMTHSGKMNINRISVPLIFILTGKNINNKIQLNQEFGFIIDQNLRKSSQYFNARYFDFFTTNQELMLEQPSELNSDTSIRLYYGLSCELTKNVILGVNAKFGYIEMLAAQPCALRCGLGMTDDDYDYSRDPRFKKVDVFEMGMTLAYRL